MVSLAAIPAAPLAGAVLLGALRNRLPRPLLAAIGVGSVAIAFLLSLLAVRNGATPAAMGEWLPLMNGADWRLALHPYSAVMILIITGAGLLIHVYATAYMAHEEGYGRFFCFLNLFVFFMLLLVLAGNLALLFAGWEGVGLCSYLLIGFYFRKRTAGDAAKKAFIVNRIGDAFFLIGILMALSETGTAAFPTAPLSVTASLCLFAGACGKSAQWPLFVWLPDAMEGPTPVSALIHAATMVTAGVYVMARAPLPAETQFVIAATGAFTAIFAATVAIAQNDIKRVLAYSTVSQLGYMFMAIGVGAPGLAMFHLLTHAFFKALLFLGAGSVIHAAGGEQDLRRLGGLRKLLPATHATMLIGTLAIAGVPGLAGYFSKEAILASAWNASLLLYTIGLTTAALTSWYMFRLLRMTFYGERRGEGDARESPLAMTIPLAILAIGSVAAGWPHYEFAGETQTHPALLTVLALGAVAAGFLASGVSVRGRLEAILANGWYFDRAVDAVLAEAFAKRGGETLGAFDRNVVDGGVNGAALLARMGSRASIFWDQYAVDGLVRLTAFAVAMAGFPARMLQSGRMQQYALFFVLGLLMMLGAYVARS